MLKPKEITALLICILLISCGKENVEISTFSPDTNLKLQVILKDGAMSYTVIKDKEVIIAPSKLGFKLKNDKPFEKFKAIKTKRLEIEEEWKNVWGEKKTVKAEYNQLILELENQYLKRKLKLWIRVFDDGVGFRYEFPKQKYLADFIITDELTEFNLTGNHSVWWQKADFDTYENLIKKVGLNELRIPILPSL